MVLTMRLDTVLEGRRQPVFSFEFFPPKTDDGVRQLFEAISHLRELEPTFVSVTYGAGGSVRTRTVDLVTRIRRELDIEPVAHLTCVDATVDDLRAILDGLRDAGIDNVLALRGDPPDGDERFVATVGGLAHGSELMELITADYGFCVGGACYPEKHPESADGDEDVRSAKRKADAGASYLITNLFFDNRMYFDFVARARAAGVTVPIIPGIMPVTNVGQIRRFTLQDRRIDPRGAPRCAALTRERPRRGAPARSRLGDAAVRRAARRGRAGRALLHDESLTGDPRDPLRVARRAPLGSRPLDVRVTATVLAWWPPA